MFIPAQVLTSLLLAISTVKGSVIAERQASVPINVQFSVPGVVFPALRNGLILSPYLLSKATTSKNIDTKSLTQGFFIIDQLLSQGPAAAARLGATFLDDSGELTTSSTNTSDNNPFNSAIYSTCAVSGRPGGWAGLGTSAASIGSAACAGSALYGESFSFSAAAAVNRTWDNPDPRQANAADADAVTFNGIGFGSSAAAGNTWLNPPRAAQGPWVRSVSLIEGVENSPHEVTGQRSDDLLMVADCGAGATGASSRSFFSTTTVYPINDPSGANKTFSHTAAVTCEAGVSAKNGGVQFHQGKSLSWVQAAPDYFRGGGVKAAASCNGKSGLQLPPKVVYDVTINGTFTRAQGFVGTLTVKKTSSVTATCS